MTDRIDDPPDLDPDHLDEEPDATVATDPSAPTPRPSGRDARPLDDEIDDEIGETPTSDPTVDPDPAPATPLFERVWRRALRRPTAWATRPWPVDRIVRFGFTTFALVITTAIMMNVVHLSPFASKDLVFDDTTPTGGDFGAHVWGPIYLRDHLLPAFRLNGWSMDWYAGMPAYRFYMVLPALAVVAVNTVLPYGVALKLVSVLGLISLPAACWAFGRLGDFRYPVPELMAFAGLLFALDESFSIYGGNLKSTMAGEFSFSIALSLAVLALGVLAAGLRTGKYRVWASILIAAACVSHGIVLIFVAVAALVFSLIWIDRTRLVYAATVGVTSLLLLSWWVVPFVWDTAYQTDMKYGARDDWWEMFFPLTAPLDILITTLAVIGFLMCIARRHLTGVALGVTGLVFAAGVYLAKDSLPGIGLLWNPRLLPFLYLVRYLMMVIGAVEVLSLAWNVVRDGRALALPSPKVATAFAGATALAVLAVLGFMFQVLPGGGYVQADDGSTRYSWGPVTATDTNTDALGDGWARYNFAGYEGRDQFYTEYHQVVTTMDRIGADPSLGCGRALWENHPDNGQYGTTMALMLLPHWTDGCIGSMEGLFFEASGTTPYHFLATAAMSKQSSNPVRELRYTDNDAAVGVRHLRDLGVRYAMVRSPEAKTEAARQPDLTFIASSTPWDIYLVEGSSVVTPLETRPVVVRERSGDPRERYLELGTSWFQHPEEWAAIPAVDGPDDWQRLDVQVDMSRRLTEDDPGGPRVDIVVPTEPIEAVPLAPVTISDVDVGQQSLSFSVDRVGVPVLVRVSYFPNWEAHGAEGPYRAGPNMMIVVPTGERVELSYGRRPIDHLSVLLTLAGVGLCVWWRRVGDVRHAAEVPAGFAPLAEAAPGEPAEDDDPARALAEGAADDRDDGSADWSEPRPVDR